MLTEEELRDRLHAESVSLMPRGDLLESLAEHHARRHRRARAGLLGGSLAATALLVAVLSWAVIPDGEPLPIEPASTSVADVLQRAREADEAAGNMIMHVATDMTMFGSSGPSANGKADSWALRSEKLGRITFPGLSDTIIRPGLKETINFKDRTVTVDDKYQIFGSDLQHNLTGSAVGGPYTWYYQSFIQVRHNGDEIGLISGHEDGFEVWLDAKTYLPRRASAGKYRMDVDWLPATAENRKLLEHTIPSGFQLAKKIMNTSTALPPTGGSGLPDKVIVPQSIVPSK